MFVSEAVTQDYSIGSDGTVTKTVTVDYKNPYVFYKSDKPDIYSKIVSESYLYYSDGDLYKHLVLYENGSTTCNVILYYPLKKFSVLVKFYVNSKLDYIDFYEFLYKKKN